MPRLIRHADYRTQPWKNGGGQTSEIRVEPAQARLDDFDWRVSMARVEQDGPFSFFAGVDRTLLVLSEHALVLRDEHGERVLTRGCAPHSFAGEQQISGHLQSGAVLDLNVMTRRERARHRMRRVVFDSRTIVRAEGVATILVGLEPGLSCRGEKLDVHDSVLISATDGDVEIRAQTAASAAVIDIYMR